MPPARRATQAHELEHLVNAQTLPDVPPAGADDADDRTLSGRHRRDAGARRRHGVLLQGCARSVIRIRRPSQPPKDAKSASTSQFPVGGLLSSLKVKVNRKP